MKKEKIRPIFTNNYNQICLLFRFLAIEHATVISFVTMLSGCYIIIKRDAYHNENRNDDDGADNNDDNDDLRIISPAAILSEAAALIRSVTCLLRSFG